MMTPTHSDHNESSPAWPFLADRTRDYVGAELQVEPSQADECHNAGRYQPSTLHARGGLGEVFRARDAELHRIVALKRLPEQFAKYVELRERFRREAEITACLEHPGIVPVYGMVDDDLGRPCYAMRFIEGETLHRAVTNFYADSAESPNLRDFARQPAFRQLLHRLIDVCNTVAYAHSRGVIHRDIKPQNIMLGQFGETLLVDWGLAKRLPPPDASRETVQVHAMDTTRIDPAAAATPVTDIVLDASHPALEGENPGEPTMVPRGEPRLYGAPLTQMGQAVGTPQYMSPEQASGDLRVGPASDIYNLGATLYFVLTGKPPFTSTDWTTVQHQICKGDFPRPRQLRREVPRDLEAICLKAMAGTPEDRYACSLDLAADLEQWLAHEPVTAWPEPLRLRAKRWVFRHRGLVMAIMMFLCSALIAATAALIAVQGEKTLTDQALERSRSNEMKLNAAVRELQQRQRDLLTEQQKTKDALALKMTQHKRARDGLMAALALMEEELFTRQHMINITKKSRNFLEHLSVYYQEFAADPEEDWLVRRSAAEAVLRVAGIQRRLGHLQEAEKGLLLAKHQYGQLLEEMPNAPCCRSALAQLFDQLGTLMSAQGRWVDALKAHKEAEKYARLLVHSTKGFAMYRQDLATVLHNYASTLEELHRLDDAQKLLDEAGDIRMQLSRRYPHVHGYQQALAAHYVNIGRSLNNRKDFEGAVGQTQLALPLLEKLIERYPYDRETFQAYAMCLADMGQYHANLENWQAAEETLLKAMQAQERLYLAFQSDAGYALQLGLTYCNLAMLRRRAGDATRALHLTDVAQRVINPLQKRDAWTERAKKLLWLIHRERTLLYLHFQSPLLAMTNAEAALSMAMPNQRTESLALLSHAAAALERFPLAQSYARQALDARNCDENCCYALACTFARMAGAFPDFLPAHEICAQRAMTMLRRADNKRLFDALYMRLQLVCDSDFAALRHRPEFKQFCEKVLSTEWILRVGWPQLTPVIPRDSDAPAATH